MKNSADDAPKKKFLIGTGHGMCTCQGAAFEYIFNIEHTLRDAGVRNKAEMIWISNEQFLGDFGMGAMHLDRGGYRTHSKVFAESLFAERGLQWITGAHVNKVEKGMITYESLDGSSSTQDFDFAMLIPPFAGVGMTAIAKDGSDMTDVIFAPNGMMKVDANYTPKPFEEWEADDWPSTLQNPTYNNIFAAGIAFAPPHPISQPKKTPNGTMITPTPPRTGMPSAMMGKAVANSICDMMTGKSDKPTHTSKMSEMGAACVASTGKGLFNGTAAAMTVYPVVPDYKAYPDTGRDQKLTTGEVGLSGHWVKHLLHFAFIWKAKLKPFWTIIPE
jgi:sulfide:quinone oxidoreductase